MLRTRVLPIMMLLKAHLEGFRLSIEPLGNYERRLLDDKLVPTNAPIVLLEDFLTIMRESSNELQDFEKTERFSVSELPIHLSSLYTQLRDTIYRSGKYELGGMNQAEDGLKITKKRIFLGYPPGNHKKCIDWILKKWPLTTSDDYNHASGYSIEAWQKIKNNIELIDTINKFETILSLIAP